MEKERRRRQRDREAKNEWVGNNGVDIEECLPTFPKQMGRL